MPSVRLPELFTLTRHVFHWFLFSTYCCCVLIVLSIPMQLGVLQADARRQFRDSVRLAPAMLTKPMPVTFTVSENTPNLTTIGRLSELVQSSLGSSDIRYTVPQNQYFDMLADSSLRVIGVLDRDENRQLCVEPGYPQQCVWTSFAVTGSGQYIGLRVVVNDVNDNVPAWAEPTITIHVTEELQEKFIAELPVAKDPDLDKNGIQGYKLQTDLADSERFELIVKSSAIKPDALQAGSVETTSSKFKLFLQVLKPLDRESQPTHNLTLLAFDGSEPYHTGRLNIIVQVTDENDHSPQFTSSSYTAVVSEDAVIGSVIPLYEYKSNSVRQSDGVNLPTETYPEASLTQLHATDRDVGPNGDIEYQFSASTDPQVLELFNLDKQTGHIRVAKQLSYDIRPTGWKFQVLAKDGGRPSRSSSTNVVIQLKDANTHKPEIKTRIHSSKRFTDRIAQLSAVPTFDGQAHNVIYIPENTAPVSEPLAIFTVGDKDTGLGGIFDCTLTHTDESASTTSGLLEDFRLNLTAKLPNWNVYSLYVLRAIDRELAPVRQLIITCTDQGQPPMRSYERLKVVLVDENDNAPKFAQSSYQIHVLEGNQPNTSVGKVKAHDPDEGANSHVTYRIQWPSNHSSSDRPFIITDDGKLVATKALDRETNPKGYRFKVIATDGGKPISLSSSIEVEILLDDVNDCTPQFTQKQYNFTIEEDYAQNFTSGRYVGQVKATDCDLGPNGAVTYSILDPGLPFEITKTGILQTTRFIDREMRAIYRLTVLAQDGAPDLSQSHAIGTNLHEDMLHRAVDNLKVRTSAAQIQITLIDVNDHYPIFVYPNSSSYQVRVSIHEKKRFIITRLVAVDKDAGPNGQIRYEIIKGNQRGLFKVQPDTGELFLDAALSAEHKGTHLLIVEASDLGTPRSQTNSLEIRLILTDEPAIGRKINVVDGTAVGKLHPFDIVSMDNGENDSGGAIELNKLIMMCIVISTAVVCVIMIFAIGIFVRRTSCPTIFASASRRRRGLTSHAANGGTMHPAQVERYTTPWENVPNGKQDAFELTNDRLAAEQMKLKSDSSVEQHAPVTLEFANSPKLSLLYDTVAGANKHTIVPYAVDEQTISNRYVDSSHNSPDKLSFTGVPSSSTTSFHLEQNTGATEKTGILLSPATGMRLIRPGESTLCAIHEDSSASIQFVAIPMVSTDGSYIPLSHRSPCSLSEKEYCQQSQQNQSQPYPHHLRTQQQHVSLDPVAMDSDADSGRGGSVNNIGIASNVESLLSSSIVNANAMPPGIEPVPGAGALHTATMHTFGLPLRYVSYSADGKFHVITPNSNSCTIAPQAVLVPLSATAPDMSESQTKLGTSTSATSPIPSCTTKDVVVTSVTSVASTTSSPSRRTETSGSKKRDCGPWRLVQLPTQELEAEIQKY